MSLPAFKTSIEYSRLREIANLQVMPPIDPNDTSARHRGAHDIAYALEQYDSLLARCEELEAAGMLHKPS